jgi:hypothetical protein
LLLLSLSRTSSLFGNLIGIIIARSNFSFQFCYFILSISIIIADFIFIFTVTKCIEKADDYFSFSVTEDKNGNYERNEKKIKNCEEKLKCEYLRKNFSLAFISVALARAIYKLSFLGTNRLIKDYFHPIFLDNKELDYKIKNFIPFIPLLFLLIGLVLSYFNFYIKNKFVLIISFLIGILGIWTSFVKDKSKFLILLTIFQASSHLIVPPIIQKSFDCFEDKQLAEIFYVINCVIYSCINILSFVRSMNFYLYIVLFNCCLIFIYKCRMDKKESNKNKNKSKNKSRLVPVSNK